uniref:Uncharacterized protein n=1 Tax=Leptocylindrus danicus TaxID=163516 RepID=A0A7S2KFS7_9STRA|mmetsp:Transcript_21928/g.32866  ORF Transcript_21928/g.32866 Transcript_21928/m.32866 type:complete len:388 (+) Transcript_21928:120-1283(+)
MNPEAENDEKDAVKNLEKKVAKYVAVYEHLEECTESSLQKMSRSELIITHDLSAEVIPYLLNPKYKNRFRQFVQIVKEMANMPKSQTLDLKQFSVIRQAIERFISKENGGANNTATLLTDSQYNYDSSRNHHRKQARHVHTSGGIQSSPAIFAGRKKPTCENTNTTNNRDESCSSSAQKKQKTTKRIDYRQLVETRQLILQTSPKKVEMTEEIVIEQPKETWKLMVTYTADQIKTKHIMCEEGCVEAASTMWMSSFGDRWDCCVSCQEKRFGTGTPIDAETRNGNGRSKVVQDFPAPTLVSSRWVGRQDFPAPTIGSSRSGRRVITRVDAEIRKTKRRSREVQDVPITKGRSREVQDFPKPENTIRIPSGRRIMGYFPGEWVPSSDS